MEILRYIFIFIIFIYLVFPFGKADTLNEYGSVKLNIEYEDLDPKKHTFTLLLGKEKIIKNIKRDIYNQNPVMVIYQNKLIYPVAISNENVVTYMTISGSVISVPFDYFISNCL